MSSSIGMMPKAKTTRKILGRMPTANDRCQMSDGGPCRPQHIEAHIIDERPASGSWYPTSALLSDLYSLAPELREQRREPGDYVLVRRAVRGDDAIAIMHVRRIVPERKAEEIGQASARFGEDNFRRARIPLFRVRREMHVKIALALDDQPDLDSDGAALHLFFDSERMDDPLKARASVRAARGHSHLRYVVVVCDARALNLKPRSLDPGSSPARRPVEKIGKRLIDHAHDGFAIQGETDLDGEISVARDETVRPVQGVDHPDAALAEASLCVDGLFGENAVVRELVTYSGDDERVGGAVCLRHGLVIVRAALLRDMERPVIIFEREGSGLARQPPRHLDLALILFLYSFNC